MLNEVVAGLTLWDRLRKWLRAKRNPPIESVAARFVRLFESHGVHRNQIPRYFGHGLSLQDVQDDESLLAKLDDAILDGACTRFAVRRVWLDGAETQIHPCHDFYKNPEDFAPFIETLKANNPDGDLDGVLIAPNELDGEALLILSEMIGSVGDKPIYRYHLCNNWLFSYWKSRAYLTACVAVAWKHKVYVRGVHLPQKEIKRLEEGKTLLGSKDEGTLQFGSKTWDPEDMALRPDVFLQGVDHERDDFGIKSGLKLWLNLEQKGYMGTGLEMYESETIRQVFQLEFAKYSINQ